MSYDVIIYDTVSSKQPWDTSKAMGGSEMQLTLLKQALENKGVRVLLTDKDEDEECSNLIISRYSPSPPRLWHGAVDVCVLAQDKENHIDRPWFPHVFVSEWQRSQFANREPLEESTVIYPFLSDEVYKLRGEVMRWEGCYAEPNRWIYAAADMKGWRATALAWVEQREALDKNSPRVSEYLVKAPAGTMPPLALACEIAKSHGMFYRNTYAECFPMTVHIAAILGLELNIKCVGHESCGIEEALNPDLDLRIDGPCAEQWMEFLGL